jgi:hypothetical protein
MGFIRSTLFHLIIRISLDTAQPFQLSPAQPGGLSITTTGEMFAIFLFLPVHIIDVIGECRVVIIAGILLDKRNGFNVALAVSRHAGAHGTFSAWKLRLSFQRVLGDKIANFLFALNSANTIFSMR